MTTKGSNYTYMYDHLSHTWTKLAPTPDGLFYSAADVVYAAGSLLLWGGKGGDQFADLIYTLSTVNPAGGWHRRATTGPGPLARSGHTLTVLNGLVYMVRRLFLGLFCDGRCCSAARHSRFYYGLLLLLLLSSFRLAAGTKTRTSGASGPWICLC